MRFLILRELGIEVLFHCELGTGPPHTQPQSIGPIKIINRLEKLYKLKILIVIAWQLVEELNDRQLGYKH